jgi:hypothetical protein
MLGENYTMDAQGRYQGDWVGRLGNVLVHYGANDSSKKRSLCRVVSSDSPRRLAKETKRVAFNFYTNSKTSPATNPLVESSKPIQDGSQLSS